MACLAPSFQSVMSLSSLDFTQIRVHPCTSLDKNRINPVRSAFPSWSRPYQLGFGPLDHSVRNAFVRSRTRDRSIAIRCSADNASMPSDSSEAAVANPRLQPKSDDKPTVEREFEALGVGEGEMGADREGEGSVKKNEEKQGGTKEVGRHGRRAGNATARREGSESKSREGEASEEEEEAVAVIAQVLMKKYGPQILRKEEEEGAGNRGNEEGEEVEGELEAAAAEEEKDEMDIDVKKEEAETESIEEGSTGSTSRLTRATTRSSLLSLYRFFSSHLGISSPSTVASLLALKPQLLRSNPTNDFLPRVHLLQSYGISDADIAHVTETGPAWLRVSLSQIQDTLKFLLAKGVRQSRLGSVFRHGVGLLSWKASSTNLDILVERAGVPVEKLGVIIERCPSFLTRREEVVNTQLEALSAYFKAEYGVQVGAEGTSTSHLKQQEYEQHQDTSHLSKLILKFPSILSIPPYRFAENIAILQSFTPPDTPSIATFVFRRAPAIICVRKETLFAKLQFFVELMGEKAAGRVVKVYPDVLRLSKENMQGKAAVLVDLIGQENAVQVVARFPMLLGCTEFAMKETFCELVREVEEVLESSGQEGSVAERLGESVSGTCLERGIELQARNSAGGDDKRCRARDLVVDLVVKYPHTIFCSWKEKLKPKVEYLKRDMGLSMMEVLAYPHFLGFSLDRRIRPRHVALVRMGYAFVAHKLVRRTSVGGRRGVSMRAGNERSKLGSVSDKVEGVERIECGAEERSEGTGDRQEQQCEGEDCDNGPLHGDFLGSDEPGGRDVKVQQLVNLEAARKTVSLQQFLRGTDKQFEEKFRVKL